MGHLLLQEVLRQLHPTIPIDVQGYGEQMDMKLHVLAKAVERKRLARACWQLLPQTVQPFRDRLRA